MIRLGESTKDKPKICLKSGLPHGLNLARIYSWDSVGQWEFLWSRLGGSMLSSRDLLRNSLEEGR